MIQRVVFALLALVFMAVVFVFLSIFVALALSAGLLLGAWAWWRGRKQRHRVIEGEYRVIESR